jgi:hypothetical protein
LQLSGFSPAVLKRNAARWKPIIPPTSKSQYSTIKAQNSSYN